MTRRLSLALFAVSAALAVLLFFELDSTGDDSLEIKPAVAATPRRATNQVSPQKQSRIEDLVATALAHPLFSPTRRPPESASSQTSSDPALGDVRLTGIVIEADRSIGAK